jgi:uncharacterized protein (DUF952 family)
MPLTAGDYVVLELAEDLLAAPIKYEAPAPVGDVGTMPDSTARTFPHLYGTINADAVLRELNVTRAADGAFIRIESIGSGRPSSIDQ